MAHRTVKPLFRPSRPCAELKLGHRSLTSFPVASALWIAAAGLLLLVAIQTGSNSTLLLAFLMLGLMLLAMFLTHDTLQGLTLRCDQPSPAFAGEPADYPLQLESSAARPRCSLRVQGHAVVVCDCIAAGTTTLPLPWMAGAPGLAAAASGADRDHCSHGVVHLLGALAAPAATVDLASTSAWPCCRNSATKDQGWTEEWQDLRPVREGERPALVDWASAARGRPLQAKVFNDPEEPEVILAPAPGVALELAREHLADRIWRLHHRGACYGLQIQGLTLAPSKGVRHRDACLEALATA